MRTRRDFLTPALVIFGVVIVILALWVVICDAQTHTMPGSNVVPSGASLTIQSGGTINAAAGSTVTGFGAGGGAPTTATYITQTADAGLSAEVPLSGLATGLLKSTTTTGALTTITDNSANWNTAFTQMLQWDGGSTNLVAATGRNSLGGTTVGQSFFTLTNPGAITFPEISATNVVSTKTAAQLKTDLSLTATDVSLGSVTNNAQTQAAIVPNTAPSAGQILIGNAGNTAYVKQTLSGSGATATLSSGGVLALSAIPESSLSITNVTTGDATTAAHGFAPKGTTGTTQFWRQDWTLATPAGGTAAGSDTQVQFNDGGTAFGGDSGLLFDKTNNILTLLGSTLTPTLKIGTLEFQDYGLGNAWIGENIYYDGAFKYRATGPGAMFYFFGNEGQFRLFASGTAGTSPTGSGGNSQLRINSDGSVALGGAMASAPGNYTASLMLVKGAAAQIGIASNYALGWSGTSADAAATIDASIDRNGSGVIGVNDVADAVTGFRIGGAAASGKVLQGNGTNYIASTPTWPTTAGTAGYTIRSDGTNFASYPQDMFNSSVTSQATFSTSDIYITNSNVTVAAGDMKAKGQYRCLFDMTKSAGTGAIVISVRVGTAGAIGDAQILTFTFGAGTAVADTGTFEIIATWRTVGSGTSAVMQGVCRAQKNAATTTGLWNNAGTDLVIVAATSSGFNSSTATSIGVSFNGSTAFAGTSTLCQATLVQ